VQIKKRTPNQLTGTSKLNSYQKKKLNAVRLRKLRIKKNRLPSHPGMGLKPNRRKAAGNKP
jgi:hypothetical protein